MTSAVKDRAAVKLAAVTPSDSADLPGGVCDSLWVGGVGNIAVIAQDDTAAVTLTAVAAGSHVNVRARRVMSTNTTATLIVAMYKPGA
jgi:hypothetical protein